MPNKNYQAGRRFEYECMAAWRERGYDTIRASGSHGAYDIVAFRVDRKPDFIQSKSVAKESTAKNLLKNFKETTAPSSFYHQTMIVKIKGGEIMSVTV